MTIDQDYIDNSSTIPDTPDMGVKVSEQIRKLVLSSGMSRNQICIAIDLDPAIMSKFINNKGGLGMECLDRLGELLKFKVTTKARKGKGR